MTILRRIVWTVSETSVFIRQAAELMSEAVRWALIDHISRNPEAGDLIPETGGLRKLRWRADRKGAGKRGGARVIYYAYHRDRPIYLLAAYGKGRAEDLTQDQRRVLVTLAAALRESAGRL